MEKEKLVEKITEVAGYEPPGVRVLLRVLAHPAIIEDTIRYFEELDPNSRCLNYEAPWNCAKEAEAKYENIKYGWLGAGHGIGYDEWWCENCRKKVMGT